MIRKLLFFAAAIVVIGAGVALYVAAGYVATPTVVVKNESDSSVEVTAFWRETSRELGRVESGSERRTRVRDEAAMTFRVVYPDGRVVASSPAVYFTSGTTVLVVVDDATVEVSARF